MNKIYLILILFLVSCTSSKKVAEEELIPDWVKQKPIIPGYYVGVGGVKKIGTSIEYTAKAREEALVDMTGDISSQVSATSVLHSIEQDYKVSETFTQRIEITTDDYVEGFEVADRYETEDMYWVLYKIDKQTYRDMKEKRKIEAISTALSKYSSGQLSESNNNPKEAISFYLQGLQAIKQYLSEETPSTYNNKDIDVGNELYASFNRVVNGFSISEKIKSVEVKRGESIDTELEFTVYWDNKAISDIPVKLRYTGGYLKTDLLFTKVDGRILVNPGVINSNNRSEKLIAEVELKTVAQKAVDDLFIRGLINKKELPEALTNIEILLPIIGFEIMDSPGTISDLKSIKSIFNEKAMNMGFRVKNGEPIADYMMQLTYQITQGESAGRLTSVNIVGELKILDSKSNVVWVKETSSVRGVGNNVREAQLKAFEEFVNALNRRYIDQGLDQLN